LRLELCLSHWPPERDLRSPASGREPRYVDGAFARDREVDLLKNGHSCSSRNSVFVLPQAGRDRSLGVILKALVASILDGPEPAVRGRAPRWQPWWRTKKPRGFSVPAVAKLTSPLDVQSAGLATGVAVVVGRLAIDERGDVEYRSSTPTSRKTEERPDTGDLQALVRGGRTGCGRAMGDDLDCASARDRYCVADRVDGQVPGRCGWSIRSDGARPTQPRR
jgi:hypothetical protein